MEITELNKNTPINFVDTPLPQKKAQSTDLKIVQLTKQFFAWLAESFSNFIAQNTARKILDIPAKNQIRADILAECVTDGAPDATSVRVKTVDGVKLDGIKIPGGNQKGEMKDQDWTLFMLPRQMPYEVATAELKKLAEATGRNILVFNYRGNSQSEGKANSLNDLKTDANAYLHYLFSKGVHPSKILLHGWSMGAGVATKVAEEHPKMSVCLDRAPVAFDRHVLNLFKGPEQSLFPFQESAGWQFSLEKSIQKIQGHVFTIQHPKNRTFENRELRHNNIMLPKVDQVGTHTAPITGPAIEAYRAECQKISSKW